MKEHCKINHEVIQQIESKNISREAE